MLGPCLVLGFILGPVTGGLLGDHNVHWPFFLAGSLTLLNALYGWFVLPESLAPERRRDFLRSRTFIRSQPWGACGNSKAWSLFAVGYRFVDPGSVHVAYQLDALHRVQIRLDSA